MRRSRDGGFDLSELVGLAVNAIHLVGLVRLDLGSDGTRHLDIERDFLVAVKAAEAVVVRFRPYEPGCPPHGMDALASLVNAVITSASASIDAHLSLSFEGDRSLEVPPDPLYEGWGLTTPTGWLGQPAGGDFRIANASPNVSDPGGSGSGTPHPSSAIRAQ